MQRLHHANAHLSFLRILSSLFLGTTCAGTLFFSTSEVWANEPQTSFVVACMRVQPRPWDKAHNFELLARYAKLAAAGGAKLVVTCEGFLDGYTSNPKLRPDFSPERYLACGEPLDGPWLKKVSELARELGISIAVGFSERRDEKMFNSFAVYSATGEMLLHYSKTHTKGESYTTPGRDFPVSETSVGKVGALICYDRRFPEVARILALKGAQVLLIPAFGTDGEKNEALLRTRAWENSVWVVYVKQNQALVITPEGEIIARDSGKGDELLFARIELDRDAESDIKERRPPEVYRELLDEKADSR